MKVVIAKVMVRIGKRKQARYIIMHKDRNPFSSINAPRKLAHEISRFIGWAITNAKIQQNVLYNIDKRKKVLEKLSLESFASNGPCELPMGLSKKELSAANAELQKHIKIYLREIKESNESELLELAKNDLYIENSKHLFWHLQENMQHAHYEIELLMKKYSEPKLCNGQIIVRLARTLVIGAKSLAIKKSGSSSIHAFKGPSHAPHFLQLKVKNKLKKQFFSDTIGKNGLSLQISEVGLTTGDVQVYVYEIFDSYESIKRYIED